jgi:hypothetical protein
VPRDNPSRHRPTHQNLRKRSKRTNVTKSGTAISGCALTTNSLRFHQVHRRTKSQKCLRPRS